jgi:hypothetical protein
MPLLKWLLRWQGFNVNVLARLLPVWVAPSDTGVGQREPWWCKRCDDTWPPGRSLCPARPQDRDLPPGTTPVLSQCWPAFSTPPAPRVLGWVLAAGRTTGRRTRPHVLRTVRAQAPGPGSSEPRLWSPRRWSTGGLAPALITCRRVRWGGRARRPSPSPQAPPWSARDDLVLGCARSPVIPRPAGAIRGASGQGS